jgi:hypothetical protein
MAGTGPEDLHALDLPGQAMNDGVDGRVRNAVFPSKCRLLTMFSGVARAYFCNKARGQFHFGPPLHIHRVCHWFQMLWVHTIRHSAEMVYLKTRRNGSISNLVSHSMSLLPSKPPVSVGDFRSLPQPTRSAISAISLFPKSRNPSLWIRPLGPRSMPQHVANMLALHIARLGMRLFGNGSYLPTTTLAQTTRVGRGERNLRPSTRIMARHITHMLPLDMTKTRPITLSQRGYAATATFAILGGR